MKTLPLLTLLGMTLNASAAIITFTNNGGTGDNLWTTATNWDLGRFPNSTDPDTVVIGSTFVGANAVQFNGGNLPSGNLPTGITLQLAGELQQASGAIRMNNANIGVASTGIISGAFWDLNNGDFTFEDGAQFIANNWEHKGANTFLFNLSATGFQELTPNQYNENGSTSVGFTVDMQNYTGGTGVIDLVDFQSSTTNLNSTKFAGYSQNVINQGSYTANLQYDDATDAVQLNITAAPVPEPSSILLAGLALCTFATHRKRS